MRDLVGRVDYVLTAHAIDEMDEDMLSVFDVENCVLTGEIDSRKRDEETLEWKYCITGDTISGEEMSVIAKFGHTGKLVIITVYKL
ncbi:MAG: DUF4258 domain-containing protein [Planctomycetes bacterium]|nr:DUF4258 domain-containing protein [Planctomycetota bacterium]